MTEQKAAANYMPQTEDEEQSLSEYDASLTPHQKPYLFDCHSVKLAQSERTINQNLLGVSEKSPIVESSKFWTFATWIFKSFSTQNQQQGKQKDGPQRYNLHVTGWKIESERRRRKTKPGPIDLLLGADVFSKILLDGRIPGSKDQPDAINTIFGYVLMGKINHFKAPALATLFCYLEDTVSLDQQSDKFWELETVPDAPRLSPDDIKVEQTFVSTHRRDQPSGRFIVDLPFKEEAPIFPNIRSLALQRFYSLERRLQKPEIYSQNCDFMNEFIALNHMESIPDNSFSSPHCYYLSHHCVLRPESLTSKLRVVFNGSAHLPNQPYLNDKLFTGPKLQSDISTILLNFRLFSYILTADISKMYGQILVNPLHTDYQRVLWRNTPNEPVKDFRINRVVYGLSCSPYLAIRCLHQLAVEEGHKYPLAAKAHKRNTYVDDIVVSCCSIQTALALRDELIALLNTGGFELKKWSGNSPAVLEGILTSDLAINPLEFVSKLSSPTLRVLGLEWDAPSDTFRFKVKASDSGCTKRLLLCNLARIFDPLGFLSPVTLLIKHIIQKIWSQKIGWDDKPSNDVVRWWEKYLSEISVLGNLNIARRLLPNEMSKLEIHCFGDASEIGYCAVLYLRCLTSSASPVLHFVTAKSKVAPVKKIVSIPRLELWAAVLAARLVSFVATAIKSSDIEVTDIFCYSDSTVTLGWLRSSPHRWKTFVSNRVSFVQERVNPSSWHYVSSRENPADLGSRGCLPSELVNSSLWWAGPSFLHCNPIILERDPTDVHDHELEARTLNLHTTQASTNFLGTMLENSSSLNKCVRSLSYLVRYVHYLRKSNKLETGFLTSSETYNSLLIFVRRSQDLFFSHELRLLKDGKPLAKNFRKLFPFLDDAGTLRVGGRLSQATISYERKFPALLPSQCRLTEMIIESTHVQYLHAGIQTVQYLISLRFWILSPKRAIRRVLSKCVKCFRVNPTSPVPLMGNLPIARISELKPFSIVGVDFAGPFPIVMSRIRKAPILKAYLALFICFSTKAVHLELVSDLSTSAFLAAFKRFVSRRGRCDNIHSDNGTNFSGASKELNRLAETAANHHYIKWHFIPSSSPHFGGLWESNIKTVKCHIVRTIGEQVLTFEKLYTLFTQVEAIMNSRPLCPLSEDPNDLNVLTPGHFLTMEPLNAPPEDLVQHVSNSRCIVPI
ncbi:uncharacterized protein LOC132697424 [Cylas formicarius]|uniref:uncharacterized protein LOC132697424 n=1 Tax=Cylas formicarius TaxID=197179 RepID=UPI002958D378|nr:uncharacterized protein LOC132697424 [Cylas formicarius]